jgi:nucleoside-triphosphatase THEP1
VVTEFVGAAADGSDIRPLARKNRCFLAFLRSCLNISSTLLAVFRRKEAQPLLDEDQSLERLSDLTLAVKNSSDGVYGSIISGVMSCNGGGIVAGLVEPG